MARATAAPSRGRTSRFQQGQLLDPTETRERYPSEVSFPEWERSPDVAYHGTFRSDWESAPVTHYGTKEQATDRVVTAARMLKNSSGQRRSYYTGETADDYGDDDDYEPDVETHTGRVFARKIPGLARSKVFAEHISDPQANAAHAIHLTDLGHETWEVPQSISDSSLATKKTAITNYGARYVAAGPEHQKRSTNFAVARLDSGRPVTYVNEAEGVRGDRWSREKTHNVSHMATDRGESYEGSIVQDPHAHPVQREWAQRQINQGTASSVPFSMSGSDVRAYGGVSLTQALAVPFQHVPRSIADPDSPHSVSHIQFDTYSEDYLNERDRAGESKWGQ